MAVPCHRRVAGCRRCQRSGQRNRPTRPTRRPSRGHRLEHSDIGARNQCAAGLRVVELAVPVSRGHRRIRLHRVSRGPDLRRDAPCGSRHPPRRRGNSSNSENRRLLHSDERSHYLPCVPGACFPCSQLYLPLNTGGRFSMRAARASWTSSLSQAA